jgi:hypothetical protein
MEEKSNITQADIANNFAFYDAFTVGRVHHAHKFWADRKGTCRATTQLFLQQMHHKIPNIHNHKILNHT